MATINYENSARSTQNDALIFDDVYKIWPSFKRYAQVVPAALAVTLLLLLAMERLITTEKVQQVPVVWRKIPNPVIDVKPPEPIIRDRVKKPVPPEEIPELPEIKIAIAPDSKGVLPPINDGLKQKIKPVLGGYSSDVPIATVLVQPDYPMRALTRGIEGWVDVRFDVTAAGTTSNVQVTQSQPKKLFNSAASKAVKSWKFQPVMVDGKGVPYHGMEQRITFQMEN